MSPLERIEDIRRRLENDGPSSINHETAFNEMAALASELAAESEWRPVGEPPPEAGWYIATNTLRHVHVYESYWSGTGWREVGSLGTTHWRPMPRGPESR